MSVTPSRSVVTIEDDPDKEGGGRSKALITKRDKRLVRVSRCVVIAVFFVITTVQLSITIGTDVFLSRVLADIADVTVPTLEVVTNLELFHLQASVYTVNARVTDWLATHTQAVTYRAFFRSAVSEVIDGDVKVPSYVLDAVSPLLADNDAIELIEDDAYELEQSALLTGSEYTEADAHIEETLATLRVQVVEDILSKLESTRSGAASLTVVSAVMLALRVIVAAALLAIVSQKVMHARNISLALLLCLIVSALLDASSLQGAIYQSERAKDTFVANNDLLEAFPAFGIQTWTAYRFVAYSVLRFNESDASVYVGDSTEIATAIHESFDLIAAFVEKHSGVIALQYLEEGHDTVVEIMEAVQDRDIVPDEATAQEILADHDILITLEKLRFFYPVTFNDFIRKILLDGRDPAVRAKASILYAVVFSVLSLGVTIGIGLALPPPVVRIIYETLCCRMTNQNKGRSTRRISHHRSGTVSHDGGTSQRSSSEKKRKSDRITATVSGADSRADTQDDYSRRVVQQTRLPEQVDSNST